MPEKPKVHYLESKFNPELFNEGIAILYEFLEELEDEEEVS